MAVKPFQVDIRMDQASYDEVQRKLAAIPGEFERNWAAASDEAAKEILGTVGLQQYPLKKYGVPMPMTPRMRAGFFWHLKHGDIEIPYRRGQSRKSQRYGTQWYVEAKGLTATVGNRATYAKYLTDEKEQAKYMADRGWRKIKEVAEEKLPEIIKIYEGWTGRALKNLGISSED